MSKIHFDKNGYPNVAFLSNAIITSPKNLGEVDPTVVKPDDKETKIEVGNYKVAPWFSPDNNYPNETAVNYLSKSEALQSAIDYKSKICLSQGFFAANIEDIDVDGNEKLKIINDPELNKFLRSPMIRRAALGAYKSLFSVGMSFPEVVLRKDGSLYSLGIHKPKHCRFEMRDENSPLLKNLLLMPNWETKSEEKLATIPILNQLSWDYEETIEEAKRLKRFCSPLGLGSIINNYYSEAPWDVARNSGTLDTSLKIAEYLDKMFDNQMSIKYHIQIPYAYWDKKYPMEDYPTPEKKQERQRLIEAEIDKLESNLTEAKNARKALITHFEVGRNGAAEEQWKIDVIDDKFKNDQYLPHAASTNAGIFNAMGINPAVKGLSMAAGPYANNQGGSNIREAFLIDVALSWVDRQEVNDFIELLVHLQFPKYKDAEIRTRIMVLTTLDTGSQTKMGSL